MKAIIGSAVICAGVLTVSGAWSRAPIEHQPSANAWALSRDTRVHARDLDPASTGSTDSNVDDNFFEPTDIPPLCRRGGASSGQCFSDAETGLSPGIAAALAAAREAIWVDAGERGKTLKALMDDYVGRRVSRLVETKAMQDYAFYVHYEISDGPIDNFRIDATDGQVATVLDQAGLPGINVNTAFTALAYAPLKRSMNTKSVIKLAANPALGMIISLYSFAGYDTNDAADKAYSSTLSWNIWRALAGSDFRKLKYQLRFRVSNTDSQAIMEVAHEKYPQNVDSIPFAADGQTRLSPIAGHGKFTPQDPAYEYLLAAPNVKTSLNMVCDYNNLMENPYIVAIHTYPKIGAFTFPKDQPQPASGHSRLAYMLLEYGPKPAAAGPSTSTTETGTVGVGRRSQIQILPEAVDTGATDTGNTRLHARNLVSPDSNSTADGDNLFYEPIDTHPICRRGTSAGTCQSDTVQSDNAAPISGDESFHVALWNTAGILGTGLRAQMNDYVGRHVSRQIENKSMQDFQFVHYYTKTDGPTLNFHFDATSNHQVATMLAQAGMPGVDPDTGFTAVAYSSRGVPEGQDGPVDRPVVEVAANPGLAILVSLYSMAPSDHNQAEDKAYSSTITWNAWKGIAGPNASKLKYHVRWRISNEMTQNIMALAHAKYPGNVDNIPLASDGVTRLPPLAGHGKFTPDSAAWPYLLAMPNVRTIVNMICDYNIYMDNPYIIAIHTYPPISSATFPQLDPQTLQLRKAYILVEYGQMPPAAGASQSTVDQGTVGVSTRS